MSRRALWALLLLPSVAWADGGVDALLASYRQAKEPEARAALLTSLGALRSAAGEQALAEVLQADPSERVRRAAVEQLLKQGTDGAARALLDAVSTWDPYVTEAVVDGLSRSAPPGIIDWILEEGLEQEADRRAAQITILGALKHEPALKAVRKRAKDKSARVRESVARAIGALDPQGAGKVLGRLLKDKKARVRVAAVEGLASLPPDQTTSWLVRAAEKDKAWQVRLAAVRLLADRADDDGAFTSLFLDLLASERREPRVRRACLEAVSERRDPRVVEALVDLLDDTPDRLVVEAKAALRRLTRTDLERAAEWTAWWRASREGFVFPEPAPEPAPLAETKTRARFYGLPVESLRPCFVIDVSGSMDEPAQALADPTRARGAAPPPGTTKLAVAKAELKRALEALPEEAEFGVILFRERTVPIQEIAVRAKPKEVRRVLALVDQVAAEGATDLYGPLAGLLHGSRPGDPLPASDVAFDTVFLLSDGLPTAGDVLDADELRRRVRDFNRFAGVRLHTIGIGAQNRALLEGLAQDAGGRYVQR